MLTQPGEHRVRRPAVGALFFGDRLEARTVQAINRGKM